MQGGLEGRSGAWELDSCGHPPTDLLPDAALATASLCLRFPIGKVGNNAGGRYFEAPLMFVKFFKTGFLNPGGMTQN